MLDYLVVGIDVDLKILVVVCYGIKGSVCIINLVLVIIKWLFILLVGFCIGVEVINCYYEFVV